MQNPISIKVDLEANAGYVRYQPSSGGQRFARNERLSPDVVIDFDADSQVLGIELLAFDDEALGVARRFAEAHDLGFPRDLAGVLVAA
jgi:uncharacterized protein YuzE